MPGYWWECEKCGDKADFRDTTGVSSMASFIWDKLVPSGWDQSYLVSVCSKCGVAGRRITYEFPRKDKVTLRVVHIVGLQFDEYVPMMWETYATDSPEARSFDFKYQRGRNSWGLNKAAVFSRDDLHKIFALYREKAGVEEFP